MLKIPVPLSRIKQEGSHKAYTHATSHSECLLCARYNEGVNVF